jgi:tetratricopeptide (TPR) repeat protein
MKFLLQRRRISIIDEVRHPKCRWGFIRENPLFQELVESLRDEEAKFLDNTTEVDSQKTRTITVVPDDQTPPPVHRSTGRTNGQAVAAKPENQRPELSTPRSAANPQFHVLSFLSDLMDSINRGVLVGIVGVVGILAIGYLVIGKGSPQKSLTGGDLIRLARVHKDLGLYEQSLGFYKKAAANGPLDLPSNVQMAILLLEVNSQTSEARRILEPAIPNLSSNDGLKLEAQLALGISYLKEGSYNRAEEIFRGILFSNEGQKEARINLGLSKILRSDFQGSLKEFNLFAKQGGIDGIAVLARALIYLGMNESTGESARLRSAVEDIDRYVTSSSEFRLEALLVKAVILQKLNDKEAAMKAVKILLDEDPFLTQDHIHNLLIDRQIVRWERLENFCDYLSSKWGDNPLGKALVAFCAIQKGDLSSALGKVEHFRKQFQKSNQLIAQQALILYRLKRVQDSQTAASLAESESVLCQRVLALNCEELQNWDCADQKWRRILLGNGQDLGALRGLAEFHWRRNQRDKALEFVRKGLVISENYRPLLELKEKIDAQ